MEKREVNKWDNEYSPFPYCALHLHLHLRPYPQRRDRRRRRRRREQCIDVLIGDLQFDAGQGSRSGPRSGPERPLTPAWHAFNGVLARYHVQRALAGDTDDEYGWEHVDVGIDRGGGDDDDDDDDEMKLAEI